MPIATKRTSRAIGPVLTAAVISSLSLSLFAAPAFAAPAPEGKASEAMASERTRYADTQKAMDDVVRAGIPGALASVKDGQGTWSGDSGVADLRTGREREARDHFRIGSITKTFVSTTVLKLEAEGKLGLDDTVDKWLPGLVSGNGHDGSKVTIRQLLNHTSGIYNYTQSAEFDETHGGERFLKHRYDDYTPEQVIGTAMRYAPAFAPGTGWGYSNTNYALAGLIIEKSTGNSYAQEVDRRILRPLGLRDTEVPGSRSALPGPSGRGYSKLLGPQGRTYDVTRLNPSMAGAAGEIVSTTGDLHRFLRALIAGELLPAAQQKELTTTVPTGQPGMRAGLGIFSQTLSCGVEVWGHNGGIHGSVSNAFATKDGGKSLTMNLNGDWLSSGDTIVDAGFCGKK
ncbi:serine hydrolase domain-containing protein [Streptomyces sp. NPDC051567]|uniref:serine hydrolase domain-containing protein n=1 Tax=Streptomyces sp. NPDC051567 TaxID=3365660 RepID=UPI00379E49C3